jgi:hypothetical protein
LHPTTISTEEHLKRAFHPSVALSVSRRRASGAPVGPVGTLGAGKGVYQEFSGVSTDFDDYNPLLSIDFDSTIFSLMSSILMVKNNRINQYSIDCRPP